MKGHERSERTLWGQDKQKVMLDQFQMCCVYKLVQSGTQTDLCFVTIDVNGAVTQKNNKISFTFIVG